MTLKMNDAPVIKNHSLAELAIRGYEYFIVIVTLIRKTDTQFFHSFICVTDCWSCASESDVSPVITRRIKPHIDSCEEMRDASRDISCKYRSIVVFVSIDTREELNE